MKDNEREIKSAIMKRIEDKDTFTFSELHSGLGAKARNIASGVLDILEKQGKIDYYKSARQYVWYKVK